ncbi:DNA polymerase-3 subunit gamma/tau [Saccharopolyspora kobensis]|uniref:DNA polymerase III subunit gamma/tau n=2 Tax=Saccharopolyspora kobensis TaxID=146035 RepID=A0A1H6DFI3_9PSEU|nr:DNA polymerase III subunit gamma and tau [Saccharopolyspora kobensis]SEG83465.1 DNA polymerase-3 subunit gamma/tau [Saccharopolyspora kobensis]SFE31319.1 DNA polymerase-3 subunit gamma/tau [Saccharopolyspora kobensis]
MALALYRKYRPATFAEVVGQEHVTEPLRTALSSGRINHAYLFSGPRGCGKTSSARILARSLNCAQGPTADPCGECDSCVALAPEGGGSVDVVELDAASHGGVDDTRELRDRAFYAPAQSRYRIFIIDEAHMVTTQGFNALLKIVEEPPEHLIFVFATTEPDKVLTTIRSRTHHYPFRLMPPGVMRELVERICADEGVQVEPAVFPLVIRAGGGSARDTLSVLDQLLAGATDQGVTYERAIALLGVTDVAMIDDMVDALAGGDAASVYATVDRLVEAGHDPRRFGSDLLDRLRDLILLCSVPDAADRGLVEAAGDELERMRRQAEQLGPATLSRFAEIVHTGLSEMRGATAPRLLLELLCARMMLPAVSDSETALLQRLESIERRGVIAPSGGGAPAPQPEAAAAADGDSRPRRVFQRPHERAAAEAAERSDGAAQGGAAVPSAAAEQRSGGAAEPGAAAEQRSTGAAQGAVAAQPQGAGRAEQGGAAEQRSVAAAQPNGAAEQRSAVGAEPQRGAAQAEPSGGGAAGAAPAAFDAAKTRQVWNDVLQAVAKLNRPTQALLLNATVQEIRVDDGVVVLSMPTSGLVKQFAQQRRLDFVRQALGQIISHPGEWEIQCVEAGAAPPPAPARPAAPKQPLQRRSTAAAEAAGEQPNSQAPGGRPSAQPTRPSQQARAQAPRQGTVPRPPEPDDIPPPPEPPDEEPPPPDYVPPPEPVKPPEPEPAPKPSPSDDEEDPEAMLAESSPYDASTPIGPDPEAAAVELFERELGARRIDN